jgi:branched-chain amino acid transport system permease protein
MRLVNLAHGDMIVLASFLGLVVTTALGIHPLISIAIVAPGMFALGYALQRVVLNPTLGKDILPPLLVTFGLSIIIQQGLQERFSANPRSLKESAGAFATDSVAIGGLTFGALPLAIFLTAVALIAAIELLLRRTRLGRIIRATSDRKDVAALMGVDSRHIFGLAMGVALAVCAIAGILNGVRTTFAPSDGPGSLLTAFEAVIIGGLGSLWGTLAGGVILGVAQMVGGKIDPGLQPLAGHLVFLAVLILRPQGLFPRTKD